MTRRRFNAPEVIQTSAIDCGPAVLASLLKGYTIQVSYSRLREACQTDIDGTSIDTLEDVANASGLRTEQVMLPLEHLRLDSAALPAIIVVRLPTELMHFVLVWRAVGPYVQIMDPADGRRWVRWEDFAKSIYVHEHTVGATEWVEWASEETPRTVLQKRIKAVCGARHPSVSELADWRVLARLDAAVRFTEAMANAGVVHRGDAAGDFLQGLLAHEEVLEKIPREFWSAIHGPDGRLIIRGAVLVRVNGKGERDEYLESQPFAPSKRAREPVLQRLVRYLPSSARWQLVPLAAAIVAVGTTTIVEGLLFRSVLEIIGAVGLLPQRLMAVAVFGGIGATLLLLEYRVSESVVALGRELEGRLNIALLDRTARLRHDYFQSRLISDSAERAHAINELRFIPFVLARAGRLIVTLIAVFTALILLQPSSAPVLAFGGAAILILLVIFRPFFQETDYRSRTHAGGLSRFYFDALLGLAAIRAHSAQNAARREHEKYLTDWYRAARKQIAMGVTAETAAGILGILIVTYVIGVHIDSGADPTGVLLIAYWGLTIPVAAAELTDLLQIYARQRTVVLRVLEPLDAEDEPAEARTDQPQNDEGALIEFSDVSVRLAGHDVLRDISVTIEPGTHVALLGASGAGKSTLLSTLLGLAAPYQGEIRVNGQSLPDVLTRHREQTAWVDPSVHLWNMTMEENLLYATDTADRLPRALATAALYDVLQRLPDADALLGEGGGFLSGGEAQQVRLARAYVQNGVRLVVLDEPFRGFDPKLREDLLARSRALWAGATLFCVTHEPEEALAFDKILFMDQGRLVDFGSPQELMERTAGPLRRLLDANADVRKQLWDTEQWTRYEVDHGTLKAIHGPLP